MQLHCRDLKTTMSKRRRRNAKKGPLRMPQKKNIPKVAKIIGSKAKATKVESTWQKFLRYLKTGLKVGARVIPHILPFLSGRHYPASTASIHSPNSAPKEFRLGTVSQNSYQRVQLATAFNLSRSSRPHYETKGDKVILTDRVLIGELSVTASTKKGDLLIRKDLNPFISQRLTSLAQYEKYKFTHAAVHYTPTCPATTSGGIVGWFEWDPQDPVRQSQGEGALEIAFSHKSAVATDCWQAHSWFFDNSEDRTEWYYVDPSSAERRLTTEATFQAAALADGTATETFGVLTLSYQVEFSIAETDSAPTGSSGKVASTLSSPTAALPYGTDVEVCGYNYQGAAGALEPIPQKVMIKYQEITNSWFSLPPGFWMCVMELTGTGLAGLVVQALGGYDYLYSDGATSIGCASSGATICQAFVAIQSTGYAKDDEEMGVSVLLSGLTTLTSATFMASYIGGHPKYVDPGLSVSFMESKKFKEYVKQALLSAAAPKKRAIKCITVDQTSDMDESDDEFTDIAAETELKLDINATKFPLRELKARQNAWRRMLPYKNVCDKVSPAVYSRAVQVADDTGCLEFHKWKEHVLNFIESSLMKQCVPVTI